MFLKLFDWMKLKCFVEKVYDNYMCIINFDNGVMVMGEVGDNIGCGGCIIMYFFDEWVFVECQEVVDVVILQNINVYIKGLMLNGIGDKFY